MSTFPNLAGVATKDLVENIGTGKFKASYINWSRTMNLLRTHAPGWLVDYVPSEEGSLLHRAPVGAYLLIRFVNVNDGTKTPALPQAVMDHRNAAIPYDKISARDISDTQRRGMCMAAAMHFGLAYELWAKLPLESGYAAPSGDEERPLAPSRPAPAATREVPAAASGGTSEATEVTFRESLLEKGVHTVAIDACVEIVKSKLGGDWAKGTKQVGSKSTEELNAKYGPSTDDGEDY